MQSTGAERGEPGLLGCLRAVPSPGESPAFGELGQALHELCQRVHPSTSLQQPRKELRAFVGGSACALLSPGHCQGPQENLGMMQNKDSPASGIRGLLGLGEKIGIQTVYGCLRWQNAPFGG